MVHASCGIFCFSVQCHEVHEVAFRICMCILHTDKQVNRAPSLYLKIEAPIQKTHKNELISGLEFLKGYIVHLQNRYKILKKYRSHNSAQSLCSEFRYKSAILWKGWNNISHLHMHQWGLPPQLIAHVRLDQEKYLHSLSRQVRVGLNQAQTLGSGHEEIQNWMQVIPSGIPIFSWRRTLDVNNWHRKCKAPKYLQEIKNCKLLFKNCEIRKCLLPKFQKRNKPRNVFLVVFVGWIFVGGEFFRKIWTAFEENE